MTKDDIIKMARVAGVRDDGHRFEFSEYKYLQRFANLVAAAELRQLHEGNKDLLEALKDMGARYGLTDLAREAIAKAEGEQA